MKVRAIGLNVGGDGRAIMKNPYRGGNVRYLDLTHLLRPTEPVFEGSMRVKEGMNIEKVEVDPHESGLEGTH